MKLFGYRKVMVALAMLLICVALLVLGYDVSLLSWLSAPLAAFFAFNGLEHLPKVIETYKKYKND